MCSVTRIYHRCLKTANIPEDWEVINMVSHMYGGEYVCAHVCMGACSLHVRRPLGGMGGGLLFFKNQERFLGETKDRGDLGRRKSIKRSKTKFQRCLITFEQLFSRLSQRCQGCRDKQGCPLAKGKACLQPDDLSYFHWLWMTIGNVTSSDTIRGPRKHLIIFYTKLQFQVVWQTLGA